MTENNEIRSIVGVGCLIVSICAVIIMLALPYLFGAIMPSGDHILVYQINLLMIAGHILAAANFIASPLILARIDIL